jgi:hypothetical protein
MAADLVVADCGGVASGVQVAADLLAVDRSLGPR